MEEGYEAGDVVVITEVDPGGNSFYRTGLKAKLVSRDEDGDWWAQFRGQGNAPDSFDDTIDGKWCIGRAGKHFEHATLHQPPALL